jgi:hypothetical protein
MTETIGRALYNRGWRQGSVVDAKLAMSLYNELAAGSLEQVEPAGSGLVLATQDCDLVKPSDKLPFVEAIVCETHDEKFVQGILANEARYFVLDRSKGLVADRNHVVLIRKEALAALGDPGAPPCGGDVERARRFSRWLGARYDRPALPDAFSQSLVKPLSAAFKKLAGRGKKDAWVNDALREIRVVYEPSDPSSDPPFDVTLIFLLRRDADLDAARGAIGEIVERAGIPMRDVAEPKKLGASDVRIVRLVAVSEARLPLLQYWASDPLPLDVHTYRGEDVIGAEPLRAEPS